MTAAPNAPRSGAPNERNSGLGVLHVVRNLDTGGAQEVVRTLVENLAEQGARPVVCSLAEGPLAIDIRQAGIPVETIQGRRYDVLSPWRFLRETVRIRSELKQIVRRHNIKVIQTHLLRNVDFVVASIGGRRGQKPRVFWTFHNEAFTLRREHLTRLRWLLRPKRWVYRLGYLLTGRRVTGLIAVATDVRDAILREIGHVPAPIIVIANGVDTRRYQRSEDARVGVRRELGLSDTTTLVIMVATFKRQKGHTYLIQAATRVLPDHPDTCLLLVGDGDLRNDIAAAAVRARITDQIRFLGDRRDVPRLLGSSDAFVLPSLWEGLPMSLLEAMATGLPCVASDVSGVREVLDQSSGLMIAPGDAAALEGALRWVLDERASADAMGQRARRRVEEKFSSQQQARRHLAAYRRGTVGPNRS